MSKPDVVEVVRFYRPVVFLHPWSNEPTIDSNSGVTAVFTLDYANGAGRVSLSVCTKDVFCKAVGVEVAKREEHVFDIELPNKENSLYDRLIQTVEQAWEAGVERQFIRRLGPQLAWSRQAFEQYRIAFQ